MNERRVPFEEVDTIFFDVGNTLISIDFDWISEELATRDVEILSQSKYRRSLDLLELAPESTS